MEINKLEVLGEIKSFLDGYNNDLKYLVNVEVDPDNNMASCVIHEPGKEPEIRKIKYTPFMYMKDLALTPNKLRLYAHDPDIYENMLIKHGITITPLKTGNHRRLKNGYCYKITSSKSYNNIINFLRDGRVYPYEKLRDEDDNEIKDKKGEPIYLYKDMFYYPRLTEQFFISTQSRLFKGFEEYKNVHRVTFDIETTGLRYQRSRVFAIGVRDNRGFEVILEAQKLEDDDAEIKLIQDFFSLIIYLQPAIIAGYNSEYFDFDYILGRAKELKIIIPKLTTTLKRDVPIKRRPNVSVKYGNTAEKFIATEMWGFSIIDIIHAVKKTAAVNSEIKANGLKYIAKFEKIARPNRTYIPGEDLSISIYYADNKIFVVDIANNYICVPDEFQDVARNLYWLQANKVNLTNQEYLNSRNEYLDKAPDFVKWFKAEALPKKMIGFIGGKNLVKNYLLDDLWETEQVDELYNQSAFMLAKIVPTTYQRVCTMGTAAIWNLLLTAWSYENDLAIPHCDVNEGFSGGLARCYKSGYSERLVKIDYAGLYPALQLTWGIFPMFDITGVIKKMLLYLTTTRNIYKKLANSDKLNAEELILIEQIDPSVHKKYLTDSLTTADRAMFKVKQLPVKILNNSLFGALGSGASFNWSDGVCAARITCNGRLELRHAVSWFKKYGCLALLMVTDGINFQIPNRSNIYINSSGTAPGVEGVMGYDGPIDEMWKYGDKTGIAALIEKFNKEEMKPPYMQIDYDGEFVSCLNLTRINYATLALVKDKKSGEMKEKIKLTGNTIKSKVMPEYIEEFIDRGFELILHGKGKEFVEYYYDYAENIYYKRIPLKKIATKNRVKISLNAYNKRGKDKNGRPKAKQAHMELLIEKRNGIAEELFIKNKDSLQFTKPEEKLTLEDKLKLIATYMPPEPALDSVVYQVNTGYIMSHGSSAKIEDKVTGEKRYASTLITAEELQNNPNMTGYYNVAKYLTAFNSRVKSLLVGFDEEVRNTVLVKIEKKKGKDELGNKMVVEELKKHDYKPDELELKNFDKDLFEESMHLEPKEVEFWNKTGYDPRLVWGGFSLYEDDKVYYEIYEGALKFLNDKMEKNGKPLIKSINGEYSKGDFVLIKDNSQYNLGVFNGVYMEIIRENIPVPKSEIEIEFDRKRAEQEEKRKNLELSGNETEKEKHLKILQAKRILYFDDFKAEFGLPLNTTMEKLFAEVPNASGTLDDYIKNMETSQEEVAAEFSADEEIGE
jgi:DNA polymerase elongation subunit (family B)